MGKIMWTTGTGIPHRSFEEEFLQGPIFFGGGVTATPELLEGKGKARLPFAPNGHAGKGRMTLPMTCQEFTIDVEMDAVKPPVWHCQDGVLQMGIPGEKERAY